MLAVLGGAGVAVPSRWEVGLPGVDAAAVRLEWVHAVVSSWFDGEGGVDHAAKMKPYAVSPARSAEGGAAVEVGLLDDTLASRLLSRAAGGVAVRLGQSVVRLRSGPRQVAAVRWADLARPTPARAWCLRFVTPVTFRRGDKFTPWPDPSAVLGGLRARWRAFAPAELPALELDMSTGPVWVTDVDGASEVARVDGRTVCGFVGLLRLECDASGQTASAVDSLVRLVPFSGVGAYTTRGFGLTRVEPTRVPRAAG